MKINFVSVLILFYFVFIGYSQNLTMIEQDYEVAKAESKKQNKMLLIDFYTTWCGPCKQIDREIFNDKAINAELAKSFVVLRYDAEKDTTHRLSLKHHVASYPTTIVLNQDHFLLQKLYGLGGADKDLVKNYRQFLNESALKNSKNEFVKGVSNTNNLTAPKFYEDFVFRTNTKLNQADLKNYWENTDNPFSEISFAVLSYFEQTSQMNAFFFANKKKYEDLFGKQDVNYLRDKIIGISFFESIATKNRPLFDSTAHLTKEVYERSEVEEIINPMEERMLIGENRWAEATEKFIIRKNQGKVNDNAINSFCWSVFEKSDDKNVLKKCSDWMKEITNKKPEFGYLDTYARLLFKSGNKKQSHKIMKKAIKIGKANKEDTKDSEKWLKENR